MKNNQRDNKLFSFVNDEKIHDFVQNSKEVFNIFMKFEQINLSINDNLSCDRNKLFNND